MEVDHEQTVSILRLSLVELGCETQDAALVLEELHQVLLRRLWCEGVDGAHRVVPGAITCVGRRLWSRHCAVREPHVHCLRQWHTEYFCVVLPGELVCVIYEETLSQELGRLTNAEVSEADEFVFLLGPVQRAHELHLSASKLPSAKENRKRISTAIQRILFPNLHGVIGKEIQNLEWPPFELRGFEVVKHGVEAAYFAVPLHELLHVDINVPAADTLFSIHRLVGTRLMNFLPSSTSNLELRRCKCIHSRILPHLLIHPHLCVVFPSPLIAIQDLDDSAVNVELASNAQILPGKVSIRPREPVSAQQLTLHDATVLYFPLGDVASVILQVVHDDTLSNPVVLQVSLHHGFLKLPVEAQHMPVQHVPGRSFRLGGLDVVLEICINCALPHGTQSFGFQVQRNLHELGLIERHAFSLFNSNSIHQTESVTSAVVLLLGFHRITRQVWKSRYVELHGLHGLCVHGEAQSNSLSGGPQMPLEVLPRCGEGGFRRED
mmetsp:Transcript_6560/g.15178  ORF Transcript_6560/g.15178 Transcript_6560/m.15178 type:complete len:493 (+) Transcript_6560:939-2417(+)